MSSELEEFKRRVKKVGSAIHREAQVTRNKDVIAWADSFIRSFIDGIKVADSKMKGGRK